MERMGLITGASSGIGMATARWMVAHGRGVILEALAAELRCLGVTVVTRCCNVKDGAVVGTLAEEIGSWAHVDVLVNAAGHGKGCGGPIAEAKAEPWCDVIETNLIGAMNMVAAFLPGMRGRNEGHIVNTGAIFALGFTPDGAAYAASKTGLRAFTQALRQGLADSSVRVSLVHPGSVNTEFSSVAAGDAPCTHPLEVWPYRPLLPEEVAEAIGWVLCRPAHLDITELVIRPTEERRYG